MKIEDHIGILDKEVPTSLCNCIIDCISKWEGMHHSPNNVFREGDKMMKEGHFARSDLQVCLEVIQLDLARDFNSYLRKAFDKYTEVYKGLTQGDDPISSWTTLIQRTVAGGGYHVWHYEDNQFLYRDRVVAWMVYLNNIPIENGGATDFLHQKTSFQPKAGTVLFWPATYTHVHRGGFLTGDIPKYIATGWFLRGPGQIARNQLQGEV